MARVKRTRAAAPSRAMYECSSSPTASVTTSSGRSASSSTTNGGPGRSLSTITAAAPASCALIAFVPKLQPPRSTITTASSARRRAGSRQARRSRPKADATTSRVGLAERRRHARPERRHRGERGERRRARAADAAADPEHARARGRGDRDRRGARAGRRDRAVPARVEVVAGGHDGRDAGLAAFASAIESASADGSICGPPSERLSTSMPSSTARSTAAASSTVEPIAPLSWLPRASPR